MTGVVVLYQPDFLKKSPVSSLLAISDFCAERADTKSRICHITLVVWQGFRRDPKRFLLCKPAWFLGIPTVPVLSGLIICNSFGTKHSFQPPNIDASDKTPESATKIGVDKGVTRV